MDVDAIKVMALQVESVARWAEDERKRRETFRTRILPAVLGFGVLGTLGFASWTGEVRAHVRDAEPKLAQLRQLDRQIARLETVAWLMGAPPISSAGPGELEHGEALDMGSDDE